MSKSLKYAYFLFVITSLIWAFASIVIKYTLNIFDPTIFLGYRFLISAIFALPFVFGFSKIKIKSKKDLFYILIYGVLSTSLALLFLFEGLARTSVITLSVIGVIAPLIAAYAGEFFLKETISKNQKTGMIIALSGAILTIVEPIFIPNGGINSFSGNLFLIGYLCFDIASVLILKILLRKNYEPTTLTNISFLIGFITLLPVILFKFSSEFVLSNIINAPIAGHIGVIYMAIASGTIAYTFRAKAQKILTVAQAAPFGYLVSVFSIPFAVLILHESFSPLFLLGSAIIIFGVAKAELKK